MEYCYGQVRSNISGSWAAYSSSIKLYKNNKNTTNESMNVESVRRTWEYTLKILKELK